MKGDFGGEQARFSTAGPNALYSQDYTLTTTWTQYEWTFTAADEQTRFVLDLGRSPGVIYVDDVNFLREDDCEIVYFVPEDQEPIATGKNKWVGCIYSPAQSPNHNKYWNQVTPENAGKWGSVERNPGEYDWSDLDEARGYASENGFPFRFHVLLWGNQQPTWLKPLSDQEKVASIRAWFQAVADHYDGSSPERAVLEYLEVANEIINDPPNGGPNPGPEGFPDYADNTNDAGSGDYLNALKSLNEELGTEPGEYDWVVNAFKLARQYFPCETKLVLNEYNVLTNYQNVTDKYLEIVELLQAEGLVDVLGFQGHSFSTRKYDDGPFENHTAFLKSNIDRLAATGLPLMVTELDIDGNVDENYEVTDDVEVRDAFQKQEFERIFGLFWNHPSMIGITFWGYLDGHWRSEQLAYLVDPCTGIERPALRDYLNNTLGDTPGSVRASANPPLDVEVPSADQVTLVSEVTLYLDENGMATLTVEEVVTDTLDVCPGLDNVEIFRLDGHSAGTFQGGAAGAKEGSTAKSLDLVLSYTCDDVGNIDQQVLVEITDLNGGVTTETIQVTVLDTFGPTLLAPNFLNVTVATSQRADACPGNQFLQEFATEDRLIADIAFFANQELGTTGITAEQFYPLFEDNCTEDRLISVRFTSVTSDIRADGSDSVTVIGVLVDEFGNESVSDTATVIFVDDTDPEAVCADITVQLDENGAVAISPEMLAMLDGGSTDNCGTVSVLSADVTDFTCDNVGETTVTVTVIDESMNTATCTATVSVENGNGPVVVTTDQTVVLSDNVTSVTLAEDDVTTATDVCGDEVTLEFDRELTFDGDDIGEVIVTVTATAANGAQTVAIFTVTVTFDQPNLACISEINLTLNDACKGLLIPEMLLTGNTGLLSSFQFDITVNDNNPSNGPVVDGCGRFQYSISPASLGDEPTIGFTGAFAPENWVFFSFYESGFPVGADDIAVAEFTDPETITLSTLPDDFGDDLTAFAGIVFGEAGTVSLSYDFNGVDIGLGLGFDDAIVLTSFEGNVVETLLDTDMAASGDLTFDVAPGNALEMVVIDDGFLPALGADPTVPSTLTVTDFRFDRPQSPLTLDFETCWGYVNAEDKTPPATVFTPDDVELLCVDIDGNTLTTLPSTINKCYLVDAGTGATVPGSMSSQLRGRLLAGGSSPLVPTFTDGCADQIRVCVNDVLEFDAADPDCNDVVLTRTFTATEISDCPTAAGEENPSVTASYEIIFSRPSLADLNDDDVEEVVEIERCGTANPTRADYPAPRPGDYPFLEVAGRRFNLSAGDAVCNIGVTYTDGEPIVTCPFTYKFVRTYTVIDWCDPTDVRTFTQVVKVGDTTAPTFSGPTQDRDFDGVIDGDLIFTTNAGNICAAYIRLDAGISASDNCSDDVTITASIYPGADLSATPIGSFDVDPTDNRAEVTSAIPVGCHLLRYTFTDECGNSDFADFPFCVEDGTAPVAICEDGLNISISSGSAAGGASTGIAILTPDMIDAGSYDDCSGVTLEIARVNASNVATEAYDQELVLTCADLGIVRVGLKVTDVEGNMNFCWLDVLVEDKNAPVCIAPAGIEISCIEARATLPADIMEATEAELDAAFGFATGVDNCEVTITSTISGSLNSCGVGSFNRVFTATDGQGFTNTNNCRQPVTVYGIHDYQVTFPADEEGTCAEVPDYNGIVASEDACDLITTERVVDTLRTLAAGEECFKLRITYDVVNWCEYGSLGQPYLIPRDGDGIRNPETQPLYLNVDPGVSSRTIDDDFAFLSRFSDRDYNPGAPQRDQLLDDGDDITDGTDDDNGNDNIDDDAYAADASRGHFRYIQFVKIYDQVAPVITADAPADCFAGTSVTCTADLELNFTAVDECSTAGVQIELDANYVAANGFSADNPAALGVGVSLSDDGAGNFTISATNVPVGNHAIRVRASDGCGNFDVEIIEFCVEGDKAPTPICISQLTVTLMPDGNGGGMAAIWASDFIASDVEDCFGNVVDKYSIYTEEEAGAAGFSPAAGRLGLELTCDSDATVPVRVYAIADNGSADYCSVFVLVQQFQDGLCEGTGGNLAGNIATQDAEMMEGVEVTLTGRLYNLLGRRRDAI